MKRQYRLRKNADFQQVRRMGQSKSTRLMVLVALPNHLSHSRFGFAVSKRIGNAVRRNKVKRQMREAARLFFEQFQPGWDLLFIARAPIRRASYADIEQSVRHLAQMLNLVKGAND
ncbi:MAG: ribonuclease P protein component [Anaerolineae bacterium]